MSTNFEQTGTASQLFQVCVKHMCVSVLVVLTRCILLNSTRSFLILDVNCTQCRSFRHLVHLSVSQDQQLCLLKLSWCVPNHILKLFSFASVFPNPGDCVVVSYISCLGSFSVPQPVNCCMSMLHFPNVCLCVCPGEGLGGWTQGS